MKGNESIWYNVSAIHCRLSCLRGDKYFKHPKQRTQRHEVLSCYDKWSTVAGCRSLDRIPVAEIFRTRPDRSWGPPSLLHDEYRVSFQGVKRSGRGVNHPPPYSAEVKERVELHHYSSSAPSWPVLGRPLPLLLFSTWNVCLKTCDYNNSSFKTYDLWSC